MHCAGCRRNLGIQQRGAGLALLPSQDMLLHRHQLSLLQMDGDGAAGGGRGEGRAGRGPCQGRRRSHEDQAL